ncbi:unnamed protein product [Adineta ricciae]|uniref:G-protein coupled receptors family 1 profile domain-containing protein n=2 Tax=Adineta ricciae TaxID=249248 RepID=A0A813Z6Z5_ADIRI|nr:unnamed protein product [Adineta ricciae]
MQRSLRCHSTFAYLAFLSLANGLLSLVHFSKWMLQYYFKLFLENSLLTCRFHRFFLDFLTQFSIFTLICVNIDRARTVTKSRPNQKYPKSKFRLVLFKELLVASLLCIFHFHWIVKYGSEVSDGKTIFAICGFHENQANTVYYYLLTTIYPPFELVVFFCLPLLINTSCTILIVRSLSIRMRTAKKFHPSSNEQSRQILSYFLPKTASKTSIHSCLCFQMQCRRHTRLRVKIGRRNRSLDKYNKENQTNDRQKSLSSLHGNQSGKTSNVLNRKQRTRRSRDIHLSAMLIGLNILYLVLNLPFNIHQTFAKYIYSSASDPCVLRFTSLLLDTLQQAFFSTNFFLYVLTNRRFREEFYNAFARILSHCKQTSTPKLPLQAQQKTHPQASSCNPSTIIPASQTSDNQTMPTLANDFRDSLLSQIDITDNSLTH